MKAILLRGRRAGLAIGCAGTGGGVNVDLGSGVIPAFGGYG